MDLLANLSAALAWPVTRLLDAGDPVSVYWLASAVVFLAVAVFIVRARARRRLVPLRALLRFAFPKRVLWHRSSRLDYKLFAVNSILMASLLGLFILGAAQWQAATAFLLQTLFGSPAAAASPSWPVFLLTMALQILALDFGYWMAHWFFHKSPILWEFHKVHHSAEVMTPATEWRQHPVELVAFPIVYGLTSGVTYASLAHVFGPEAQQLGLMGQNLILVAHLATFHHLRHSHVYMPFTGAWGRLLHSPAHHQIHHSADARHFDRNFGYLFSVWDWAFGTLHLPRAGERLVLGIGTEGDTHNSVVRVMTQPFAKAWRLIRGRPA